MFSLHLASRPELVNKNPQCVPGHGNAEQEKNHDLGDKTSGSGQIVTYGPKT